MIFARMNNIFIEVLIASFMVKQFRKTAFQGILDLMVLRRNSRCFKPSRYFSYILEKNPNQTMNRYIL